jgi:peptidoglycan L-alanyl-D-glutamate endopeptidase CwlK
MSVNELNMKRLATVHAVVRNAAFLGIQTALKQGVIILVTQALRTVAEQDALYAIGRTKPGKIVTKARGGSSWHNYGLAIDCVPIDSIGKADWNVHHPSWAIMVDAMKSQGFEWGGDWKTFKDRPHFQMVGNLTIARAKELYAAGGLSSVWSNYTQ